MRDGANTERRRFTKAHEIGHGVLHAHVDQLARCTGGGGGDSDGYYRLERAADDFAAEIVLTERPVRARVESLEARGEITFEHLSALAAWRGASLSAAAIRVAEFARGESAFVHVTGGIIDWAAESTRTAGGS